MKGLFALRLSRLVGYDLLGWAPAELRVTRRYLEGSSAIHRVGHGPGTNYQTLLIDQELCLSYYSGAGDNCVVTLILENEAEHEHYHQIFEKKAKSIDFNVDYDNMNAQLNALFQELLTL